ncbi:MAG: ROK family protein [Candidatus Omnitrophica bacterium]|nr:ROK family protein [Candidatus Omnitrophota bacterium]
MKKYTIGIDVGGTNIKLGLVSSDGTIALRDQIETKDFYRSKNDLIKALIKIVHHVFALYPLKKRQIEGVGIGLPGLVNVQTGYVIRLTNIPGWHNVPLKKLLDDALKMPVYLDNDVNVIALGEWQYGAGKGYQNLVCITLGTGVGGGIILNNSIYRGEGFFAGEIGHIPLNKKGPACNCGGSACFEQYVGNKQILRQAQKLLKNKALRLEDVAALARKGNKQALQFWSHVGEDIGQGLVGVVNLLNPRLIVIGGGVAKSLKFMKKDIQRVIRSRAMSVPAKMVKIVPSKLGNDAGVIGASVLVNSHARK